MGTTGTYDIEGGAYRSGWGLPRLPQLDLDDDLLRSFIAPENRHVKKTLRLALTEAIPPTEVAKYLLEECQNNIP